MTGTDNNSESRCPTWTTGRKNGVRFNLTPPYALTHSTVSALISAWPDHDVHSRRHANFHTNDNGSAKRESNANTLRCQRLGEMILFDLNFLVVTMKTERSH